MIRCVRIWTAADGNSLFEEGTIELASKKSGGERGDLLSEQFFPNAKKRDWKEAVAGQRVQTIKPYETTGWFKHEAGALEFGTELVAAEDKSLVALLGALPGASTAASIALEVLRKCSGDRLTDDAWLPRLKQVIPTYGIDLATDAGACRKTRADTAPVLRVENV